MNTNPPIHQRPSRLKRFLFGAPYYPEHWTAADMEQDAERMAAAGMNVVRMAEFAWDRIEPRRGEFDFSLFDAVVEKLGKHGIDTILCTPTATPPRWLTADHEDWMRIDADGRPMVHGSRQHCCTNNLEFRDESERITLAMAEHYAGNPHVIGWQTDNEFYCHFSECHCRECERGFRIWLQQKYEHIAALNRAWGTAFWAQTYDDFDQIPLPKRSRPAYPNPSHELDYLRFVSDSLCEFQRGQVNILRGVQDSWWITHNVASRHLEIWDLSKDLDFLGMDVYPGFSVKTPRDFSGPAMANEFCRASTGSYIIPEQQGGAGGQLPYLHDTPAPGQMRLWAYQGIAHGADGMLHFRWRTCRFGAEIYWNGILDHDNVPRRRYAEFSQEGAELKRIGDKILGTVLLAEVGVLIEQEQEEAHGTMHMGLPSPKAQRELIYHELLVRHLPAGYIHAQDSFAGTKVLFLPSFPMIDDRLASKLRAFVEEGGVLIATARTATRDRNNHVLSVTPPGALADIFGTKVEEFGKLNQSPMHLAIGESVFESGGAYEVLDPFASEVLARWLPLPENAPHAAPGKAAVTLRRLGKGCAIYVGTYFTPENLAPVLEQALAASGIDSLAVADPFIEVTLRHAPDRKLHFVLNHYPSAKTVSGLPPGTELITETTCTGSITIPPYGVAVVQS